MRHPFDRDNERLLAIMMLAAKDIDEMCKEEPAAAMEAATGRY